MKTPLHAPRTLVGAAMLAAAVLLALPAPAVLAASVGDTLQQVLAEKGKPKSQIDAGAVKVFTYPDVVIKLKDDVVVSVKAAPPETRTVEQAPPPAAARPPNPVAQIEAAKRQLEDAVTRVVAIVNQGVPHMMRGNTQAMEYFYHDGATRPDFGTVDVRKTQEPEGAGQEFITFKGHEDWIWQTSDIEFNSMLKYFYVERTQPKKKLTEEEMVEINRLYRLIALSEQQLAQLGYKGQVP